MFRVPLDYYTAALELTVLPLASFDESFRERQREMERER